MGNLILVEGPDKAGKTTLAKRLSYLLGWHYLHTGPAPDLNKAFEHNLNALNVYKDRVVIDRLHLSTRVYGPIFHNRNLLSTYDIDVLEGVLRSKGALIVYCRPSNDSMDAKLDALDDPYESLTLAKVVRESYDSLMRKRDDVYHYDYTTANALGRLLEWIESSI